MRIIAESEKEGFKITVFKYEEKVSIKLERDQMEYLHKFRQGAIISDQETATTYIDLLFEKGFLENHLANVQAQTNSLKNMITKKNEEFPKIL